MSKKKENKNGNSCSTGRMRKEAMLLKNSVVCFAIRS